MAAVTELIAGLSVKAAMDIVAVPGGSAMLRLEICDYKDKTWLHIFLTDNGHTVFHVSADARSQVQCEICIQEVSPYKDKGRAWVAFEMDLGKGNATLYLNAENAEAICTFLSANGVIFYDWRVLT
jgi:Holliday junction resolvase